MNVLVVSSDVLHIDAIVGYLQQSDKPHVIQTRQSYSETSHLSLDQQPDLIILDQDLTCGKQPLWASHPRQVSIPKNAFCVALVSEIRPAELAVMLSNNVKAVLHTCEAKEYLEHWQYQETIMDIFLSTEIKIAIGHTPRKDHPLYTLSKIELQTAALIIQGLDSKQIADRLYKSILTVESYRKNIKAKLSADGGKNTLLQYLLPFTQWITEASKNTPFLL